MNSRHIVARLTLLLPCALICAATFLTWETIHLDFTPGTFVLNAWEAASTETWEDPVLPCPPGLIVTLLAGICAALSLVRSPRRMEMAFFLTVATVGLLFSTVYWIATSADVEVEAGVGLAIICVAFGSMLILYLGIHLQLLNAARILGKMMVIAIFFGLVATSWHFRWLYYELRLHTEVGRESLYDDSMFVFTGPGAVRPNLCSFALLTLGSSLLGLVVAGLLIVARRGLEAMLGVWVLPMFLLFSAAIGILGLWLVESESLPVLASVPSIIVGCVMGICCGVGTILLHRTPKKVKEPSQDW